MYIFLILCIFVAFLYKYNRNYWKTRHVKQTSSVTWKFLFDSRAIAEIFKDIYDAHPKDLHIGTYFGNQPLLVLRDLQNIQAVMANDFQSFSSRGFNFNKTDLLSDNVLVMNDVKRWKLIRQKISPIFTSFRLKNLFYILDRCGHDFATYLDTYKDINVRPFTALYNYTVASIGASIFGIDINTKNTMDSPFINMVLDSAEPSLRANLTFFLSNDFPKLFQLLDLKLFGNHEDFFINIVKKVLTERRKNKDVRHDFIDLCLELQNNGTMKDLASGYEVEPTDEVLAAQAFFFFIAGADTSATSMHFTLIELCFNPDILRKLHHEIDTVFEESDKPLKYEDIEKMKYLDMVLSEALRKYPPIGSLRRNCTKNTILPVGGLEVTKGTGIVIPVYALHRDERYYTNPDLFDPERFATDNFANENKFSYLPFGEGNRMCIGTRYARLQVKAGLAWLLRKYTLKQQDPKPIRFEHSIFALRATDFRYELIPRNKTK